MARQRRTESQAARECERSLTSLPVSNSARRSPVVAAEGLVACGVALAFVFSCRSISVDPIDRIGQVSGLAGVQLRLIVAGGAILTGLVLVGTRRPEWSRARGALVAASAGLTTAVAAGGLLVALHGTPWGLYAYFGDAGNVATWAEAVVSGGAAANPSYPPLFLWLLGGYARLRGVPTVYAAKDLAIVLTALLGPATYVAWRTLLSPLRALVVGGVTAVMFMDFYKPYASLVLLVLPPVLIQLVRLHATLPGRTTREIAVPAAMVGATLGLLFATYPGWFVWSGPGITVVVLLASPWRGGVRPLLISLGTVLVAFLLVAGVYLRDFLSAAGTIDDYFYFDTSVEPTYIAMFRGDLPGVTGPWPPIGEVGGVGVFTILLVLAVGLALWRAGSSFVVRTCSWMAVSAWTMRMWLASRMYATETVQLYPRTTSAVLLSLVIVAAIGSFDVVEGIQRHVPAASAAAPGPDRRVLAVAFAILALTAMAGSATADRYQPSTSGAGMLAYYSHITPLLDGGCPRFAPGDACTAFVPPG